MTDKIKRALGEIDLIAKRLHLMGTLTVAGDPDTDPDGEQLQKQSLQINRGQLASLLLSTSEDIAEHVNAALKALGE